MTLKQIWCGIWHGHRWKREHFYSNTKEYCQCTRCGLKRVREMIT